MGSRLLRELRSLTPWTWDARVEKHPPGQAAMRDFQEVFKWEDPVAAKSMDTPARERGSASPKRGSNRETPVTQGKSALKRAKIVDACQAEEPARVSGSDSCKENRQPAQHATCDPVSATPAVQRTGIHGCDTGRAHLLTLGNTAARPSTLGKRHRLGGLDSGAGAATPSLAELDTPSVLDVVRPSVDKLQHTSRPAERGSGVSQPLSHKQPGARASPAPFLPPATRALTPLSAAAPRALLKPSALPDTPDAPTDAADGMSLGATSSSSEGDASGAAASSGAPTGATQSPAGGHAGGSDASGSGSATPASSPSAGDRSPTPGASPGPTDAVPASAGGGSPTPAASPMAASPWSDHPTACGTPDDGAHDAAMPPAGGLGGGAQPLAPHGAALARPAATASASCTGSAMELLAEVASALGDAGSDAPLPLPALAGHKAQHALASGKAHDGVVALDVSCRAPAETLTALDGVYVPRRPRSKPRAAQRPAMPKAPRTAQPPATLQHAAARDAAPMPYARPLGPCPPLFKPPTAAAAPATRVTVTSALGLPPRPPPLRAMPLGLERLPAPAPEYAPPAVPDSIDFARLQVLPDGPGAAPLARAGGGLLAGCSLLRGMDAANGWTDYSLASLAGLRYP